MVKFNSLDAIIRSQIIQTGFVKFMIFIWETIVHIFNDFQNSAVSQHYFSLFLK